MKASAGAYMVFVMSQQMRFGTILGIRATTVQRCAAVPRTARIQESQTFGSQGQSSRQTVKFVRLSPFEVTNLIIPGSFLPPNLRICTAVTVCRLFVIPSVRAYPGGSREGHATPRSALFFTPKLTNLYREASMSPFEKSVNHGSSHAR